MIPEHAQQILERVARFPRVAMLGITPTARRARGMGRR